MNDFIIALMIFFFIAIVFICLYLWEVSTFNSGYKQGQIDCFNGDMKYELTEYDNGEVHWEEKE